MWEQVQPFNLSKMGKRAGYCLQNVRLAFGVPAKYNDAKAAMLANKYSGTLHDISTLPDNVAVPVFVDTSSVYEHIEVADKGTFYSDGKKLTNPMAQKFFGWGETLNGERIVKWVEEPKPEPQPEPKKSNEEIADEVIAGKWGNGQERKDRLAAAGYDWGAVQEIVDQKLKGKKEDDKIKVGDKVTLTNWVDFNGTRLAKTRDYYYVSQLFDNRAVLRADNAQSGPIYAAVNVAYLRKV